MQLSASRKPHLLLLIGVLGFSSQFRVAAQATDTVRTASGLRYVVRQPGHGPHPRPGDRVAVNYTGFLPDGHIFDSSATNGGPVRFRVGRKEVIPGWDEVLPLLAAGARVRVWLPAALGYGPKGMADPDDALRYLVPPNSELEFELEVIRIK